ncbi:MAG: hypothetical protein HC828_02755 [Blastochloris sp.]|nr:hypothetical protein [Blastochloris sp.]
MKRSIRHGACQQGQQRHAARHSLLAYTDQPRTEVNQAKLHEGDVVVVAGRHHADE